MPFERFATPGRGMPRPYREPRKRAKELAESAENGEKELAESAEIAIFALLTAFYSISYET